FTKLTDRSIMSRDEYLKELDRVRELGFATDDEEGEVGARCVGAPVLDGSGGAIAAISISGPTARVTRERVAELARTVIDVARQAQSSLGMRSSHESAAERGVATTRGSAS